MTVYNRAARDLRPYKGYRIQKCYWEDEYGTRVGSYFYLVAKDDNYVGEEYASLTEAKKAVDHFAS